MYTSDELALIKQMTEYSLSKLSEGKEDIKKNLESILTKTETVSEYNLPTNIKVEEIGIASQLISSIEANIQKYVSLQGSGNLVILEEIKKSITGEMVTLATFRDRFTFELEYLEDVFKKEIFSQLMKEISFNSGVSVTQAEKLVNNDDRYKKIRRDLHNLRLNIGTLKTKYAFFEKTLQLIIQSVSVASKELHNSKLDN